MGKDREDVNEELPNQPEDVDGEQNDDKGNEDEPSSRHGERPDNLRRRAEWFQKRTGGR